MLFSLVECLLSVFQGNTGIRIIVKSQSSPGKRQQMLKCKGKEKNWKASVSANGKLKPTWERSVQSELGLWAVNFSFLLKESTHYWTSIKIISNTHSQKSLYYARKFNYSTIIWNYQKLFCYMFNVLKVYTFKIFDIYAYNSFTEMF